MYLPNWIEAQNWLLGLLSMNNDKHEIIINKHKQLLEFHRTHLKKFIVPPLFIFALRSPSDFISLVLRQGWIKYYVKDKDEPCK